MDVVLEQVRKFAEQAHGDQLRRYSEDKYIVHPVRVMETVQKFTPSIVVAAAALLHDVLEDTTVTEREMLQFLNNVIDKDGASITLSLVVELTDMYTKNKYGRWNRRKRKQKEADRLAMVSGDAQTIKYADIIDNAVEIVVHDPAFAAVFLFECKMLLRKIPKGNAELYREAVRTVDECLAKVPRRSKKYRS